MENISVSSIIYALFPFNSNISVSSHLFSPHSPIQISIYFPQSFYPFWGFFYVLPKLTCSSKSSILSKFYWESYEDRFMPIRESYGLDVCPRPDSRPFKPLNKSLLKDSLKHAAEIL